MLRKLHERARDEKGFTLIELLVVILIIGILAAIAIPSFINQRSKGTDAEAKAAAKTAAEAEETYFTDNQSYTSVESAVTLIEPTLNDLGPRLSVTATGGGTGYIVTITADRDNGAVTYTVTKDANGNTTRSCAHGSANAGGCNGNTW